MNDNDVLEKLGIELNPCKLCGEPAEIDITKYSSQTGVFADYYNVLIKCRHCKNHMVITFSAGLNDEGEIRRAIQKWNNQEISANG